MELRGDALRDERGLAALDLALGIVDRIIDGEVHFVINTTAGKQEIADSYSIRRETLMHRIPYFTTLTGARAAVGAMEAARRSQPEVRSLQEYHRTGSETSRPGRRN